MPRLNTPDRRNDDGSLTVTAKRCCDGCDQPLGDLTDGEMAALVAGLPLPDARQECTTCGPTLKPGDIRCRPMRLIAGPEECLEQECEDYFDEDGEELPDVDQCSHIRQEIVCVQHSTVQSDGSVESASPWPCPENPNCPELRVVAGAR